MVSLSWVHYPFQFCPSLLTVHHGWENYWTKKPSLHDTESKFKVPQNIQLRNKTENLPKKMVSFQIMFGTGLFLACFWSSFPRNQLYHAMSNVSSCHFWLPSLITVFPHWRESESEPWENKIYRVGCCSWSNYSHLIGLHPHPSSSFSTKY